jgi:hypothetical protein
MAAEALDRALSTMRLWGQVATGLTSLMQPDVRTFSLDPGQDDYRVGRPQPAPAAPRSGLRPTMM